MAGQPAPSLPGSNDFIRRYIAGGGGVARFSAHKHWGITSWFLITKVHHGYDLEAGRTCGLKLGDGRGFIQGKSHVLEIWHHNDELNSSNKQE